MVSRLTATYTQGMENDQNKGIAKYTPNPVAVANAFRPRRSNAIEARPTKICRTLRPPGNCGGSSKTPPDGQFCSGTGTPNPFNCYWGLTRERLVAKKPKKLEDLFYETLKDIYF